MKIQAINASTSFKGLFTDKTSQNNGNWRMEYQPYSWERNNTSKMTPKERIDIFASSLPDNEEIFQKEGVAESSKDILGTESYYVRNDNTVRKTITEMPSLNREESLKVVDKKLDAFLDLKKRAGAALSGEMDRINSNAAENNRLFDYWNGKFSDGYEYSQGLWQKSEGINRMNSAKNCMVQKHDGLNTNFNELLQTAKKYTVLANSTEAVHGRKKSINEEIKQLGELRSSGKLIDISRRDIPNANEALIAALQNLRTASEKFICLPHKLITMEEVLKIMNPRNLPNVSTSQVIHYVEGLIKKTV